MHMPGKLENSPLGSLGDVVRPVALKRLLSSIAPPNQCFWYAHPWAEDAAVRGKYTAEFSNGDVSRFVPVSADYAEEVMFLASGAPSPSVAVTPNSRKLNNIVAI